jgi:hypothetical protein
MPDATEKLIEAIRKCPILYAQSLKEYRDTRQLLTLNIPGLRGTPNKLISVAKQC